MDVETGLADVGDGRLYYEVAGSGSPLVLIHGFTLDRRMWDDQFEHFADRYRVVRYDQRGFGRSDVPTEAPYSNHGDLRRLLDHLGIDAAHVCGLSSGGGVAIDLALEHPGSVHSLVGISSALGGSDRGIGSMIDAVVAMNAAAGRGDIDEAKRIWLTSSLFAPARRDPAVAARLIEIVGDWSGWHLTNQADHVDPEPAAAQRLDRLGIPMLLLTGELDNEAIQLVSRDIEQGAPNARVVVVPDVGHMVNMEAPDVVNDHIGAFLAGVG